MIIINTEYSDINFVLDIYREAVLALKAAGVDQWQTGYPCIESLKNDIHLGISRVCIENDKIVATAAAYVGHEPTYDKIFEGSWLTDSSKYGIVHRIAVLPENKGLGVSGEIFEFTAHLSKELNVSSLRCDTHRDNLVMQRALKKFGFIYCGIIYLEDGAERLAFEKLL